MKCWGSSFRMTLDLCAEICKVFSIKMDTTLSKLNNLIGLNLTRSNILTQLKLNCLKIDGSSLLYETKLCLFPMKNFLVCKKSQIYVVWILSLPFDEWKASHINRFINLGGSFSFFVLRGASNVSHENTGPKCAKNHDAVIL